MEKIKNKEILIIGGTGFIGKHLVKKCLDIGLKVTSLSLNKRKKEGVFKKVKYIYADFTKSRLLKKKIKTDFDYIVNLGGYIDHSTNKIKKIKIIKNHFDSTVNLILLKKKKLKRYIHIGSSDEYGDSPSPQHEEIREKPISPYSLAKASGTHLLQMLHRTERYPAVILRLFLSYGPGQNSNRFIPQIILGCLRDNYFPTSSGMQVRDLCYVKDTIDAIVKAMLIDESIGHVINIASGQPITIRKVIEKVVTMVGKGRPNFGEISYRPGENMSLYANTKKAEKILDWRPVVSLEEGLESVIQWYAKHG